MASVILFFLPAFPFAASFLTPREKAIAQARLKRDHNPQSHGGMKGWQGFKTIIADINAWLFMLIYASCNFYNLSPWRFLYILLTFVSLTFLVNVGVATISYFLPTVRDLIWSRRSRTRFGLSELYNLSCSALAYPRSWFFVYQRARTYCCTLHCGMVYCSLSILAQRPHERPGLPCHGLLYAIVHRLCYFGNLSPEERWPCLFRPLPRNRRKL